MNTKKLSKSIRKFIREEKARIRWKVLDLKEQEKLIRRRYAWSGKRSIIIGVRMQYLGGVAEWKF